MSSGNQAPGLMQGFRAARRVGTPLVAIGTADQFAVQALLVATVLENPNTRDVAHIRWDTGLGFQSAVRPDKKVPATEESHRIAQDAIAAMCGEKIDPAGVWKAADALMLLQKLPENAICYFHNADRFVSEAEVAQGIANLRDPFKRTRRTLTLLCPRIQLPANLQHDVVLMEHALPTDERLDQVIIAQYRAAGLDEPLEADRLRAREALRGLSEYGAENQVALSMTQQGVNLSALWYGKQKAIEQQPGLRMHQGGKDFSGIGGFAWLKAQMQRLFDGDERPAGVVYIEELEKHMRGANDQHGDNTGVSHDFLQVFLTSMENNDWDGIILIGPAGSGKSHFSQSLGGEFRVPTLEVDLGAMKQGELGASEQNIRNAMRVIEGICGKRAFFVASCNGIQNIPPSLQRRFRVGTFYTPMASREDLQQIWDINIRRFELSEEQSRVIPTETLYMGAEIRTMCSLARKMRYTLDEASQVITPLALSDPDSIDSISRFCNKRYRGVGDGKLHQHRDLREILAESSEGGSERSYRLQD